MSDERAPVTLRDGTERLDVERWASVIKEQTARDLIGFLRHCKELRSPASIAVAKGTIAHMEAQAHTAGASSRGGGESSA